MMNACAYTVFVDGGSFYKTSFEGHQFCESELQFNVIESWTAKVSLTNSE